MTRSNSSRSIGVLVSRNASARASATSSDLIEKFCQAIEFINGRSDRLCLFQVGGSGQGHFKLPADGGERTAQIVCECVGNGV